jgi:hypothetical protein
MRDLVPPGFMLLILVTSNTTLAGCAANGREESRRAAESLRTLRSERLSVGTPITADDLLTDLEQSVCQDVGLQQCVLSADYRNDSDLFTITVHLGRPDPLHYRVTSVWMRPAASPATGQAAHTWDRAQLARFMSNLGRCVRIRVFVDELTLTIDLDEAGRVKAVA